MKSKDLQKLVLSKYEKGEGPSEIFRHLNDALCLRTVKRWCKMIRETGSINCLHPQAVQVPFERRSLLKK